jgi:putative ribosome biogenesis GTPase RsgA
MSAGPRHIHGLVRIRGGRSVRGRVASWGVVEAVLRGRLKQEQRTGDAVVVGDRVEVPQHEDGNHTIERVAERETELARKAPGGGGRRAKVMAANVDQIVVVFAVARPTPRLRMLDRFLVLAEANGLDALVVANKTDLGTAEELEAFRVYEPSGTGSCTRAPRPAPGWTRCAMGCVAGSARWRARPAPASPAF